MAMKMAVNIFLFLSCLAIGISAGEYCEDGSYCLHGCCADSCCSYFEDDGLSDGALAGIIVGALILKIIFWTVCCMVIRRRRQTVIVQRVMVPQTSVTVSSTNQYHAGYDQVGAMRMAQPPRPGPGFTAPPPYEQPTAIPPPK